MAVPKRKHSNARTGSRRSQDNKKPIQLSSCPTCNKLIPTHIVCPNCGSYQGRTIINEEEKQ